MAANSPIRLNPADSDGRLVGRFVSSGDQQAFEMLVRRHQQMVMGVCRRVLSDHEDAEDAFQATFLVLARSAKKIRRKASVSSWLYGVAFRVSMRTSRNRYRRREASLDHPIVQENSPLENVSRRHEARIVDEELSQMAEAVREPLVLHHLAGKTNPEIAKQLGISVAAVEGRLKRGRKVLGQKLARRGVGPMTVVALSVVGTRSSVAGVRESLIEQVVEQGVASTTATGSQGVASAIANEEVLQMTIIGNKLIASLGVGLAMAAVVVVGFLPSLTGQDNDGTSETGVSTVVLEASQDGTSGDQGIELVLEEGSTGLIGSNASAPTSMSSSHRSAVRDIEMKLANRVVDVELVDVPLSDFADYMSQTTDIPIMIDVRALEDFGYSEDTVIDSIPRLRSPSARSVLRLALQPLDLTYIIEDEVLKITTVEVAESRLDPRVYPLSEFGSNDLDAVIELITTIIAPDSWSDVGGPGQITAFENSLVISQTQVIHEKILDLILQLRELQSNAETRQYGGLSTGGAR